MSLGAPKCDKKLTLGDGENREKLVFQELHLEVDGRNNIPQNSTISVGLHLTIQTPLQHLFTHPMLNYVHASFCKESHIFLCVSTFVAETLKRCRPIPNLFVDLQNSEENRITQNMILDSMGHFGDVLGAAAYRLADQLEIELPENNIAETLRISPVVVNGVAEPSLPSGAKVSQCYTSYFQKDERAVLVHNSYLCGLLRDRYTQENNLLYLSVVMKMLGANCTT